MNMKPFNIMNMKPFNTVNAKTLFDYINKHVFKDQILLTTLISNLCYSTNMRGKPGFETLLQDCSSPT